ncbi:MAG: HAD family hydrolase [Thermoplasmata archaeon]|nr:MAG: HAD family hydrolase [Thermoplasmata archaeon]
MDKIGKECVIITDLDGTLIDSDNENFALLMKNLKKCGFDDKIDLIVEGLVSGWDFDTIMEKIEMPPDIRKDLEEKIKTEISNQNFNLLPGVRPTLEQLFREGFELSIVTDNYYRTTVNCLEKTKISHYFDNQLIFGSDNFAYQKPSKDVVNEILKRSNRKYGIIIGNSSKEVAFAKNVGLPIILLENNHLKNLNGYVLQYYQKIREEGEQESYERLFKVKNWEEILTVLNRVITERNGN